MGLCSQAMKPEINIYDSVLKDLRARRMPQKTVAARSGVPFSTVSKVAQGAVKDPSVHTVQRLYDFFRSLDMDSERKAA